MSHTLDVLERVHHGTPAGYVDGCRSRGGCPNHGSRSALTCIEATRARQRHYALSKLDPNVEITRPMVRLARRSDHVGIDELLSAREESCDTATKGNRS